MRKINSSERYLGAKNASMEWSKSARANFVVTSKPDLIVPTIGDKPRSHQNHGDFYLEQDHGDLNLEMEIDIWTRLAMEIDIWTRLVMEIDIWRLVMEIDIWRLVMEILDDQQHHMQ